jgi:EAL domain-containing protein (putative c-di-GMP-specific phosphodiesterase class I)
VGASIGIVPIRRGMRPAEILREADAACYAAKRTGGDRVQVSDASPPAEPRDQEWSRRVVRTVEEHRFQLYAQPVVPLNRVAGRAPRLELLLRLEEEPGTAELPRSFLPAVRRYGLLPSVDEWVIREAVRRLGEWGRAHAGKDHPTVAVNLSDETVASGRALSLVEGALAGSEVPAEALCFEISEATVAAHPTASAELVRRLRTAGCRTTVEHCGTGMAAFTQLRRLRPDFLKIAGHIVRSLDRDPVQRALAGALNEVGHVLGLRTIGCQVEGGRVLEHLRQIGVDFAQGFGLGRPEPFADAVARLG